MGDFLTPFVRRSLENFDVKADGDDDLLHLGNPDNVYHLISFGIDYNVYYNYSLIKFCEDPDCKLNGFMTIDGKYVKETVKKFFDIDIENQTVTDEDMGITIEYDGKVYHFDGDVEGEDYSTVVEKATRNGKIITMLGTFYSYNKPFRKFAATAKNHKYKGKNTFAILSLKVGEIIQ